MTLFTVPAVATTLWGQVWQDAKGFYAEVAASADETFPPPSIEEGKHDVQVVATRRIVPSLGLGANVQRTNNNLDVVRHDGRVYLAFRSSSDHLPSAETTIQVVSSEDELEWKFEHELALGRELREPRFLSYNDKLMLYVSRLSNERHAFEPQDVLALEHTPRGWSQARVLNLSGHIVWRTKVERGIPLMTAYAGGTENDPLNQELEVKLLTTNDGYDWRPLQAGESAVYRGGGSQAAFTSDDDGNLYSVIRNDAGDAAGWGSSVCMAPSKDWTDWDCVNDPKKYDSPAMFAYDGEIYMIARRNVSADGRYDQGFGPDVVRSLTNQLDYVTKAKRCSVWRYVRSERRVAFVVDLPSRGDTCFPAVMEGEQPGEFVIYDYSSDIRGADLPYGVAQAEPTFIYRHVLQLEAKPVQVPQTSL